MKKQLLMVTEKWCDANPDLALTNNFHNLFNTFSDAKGSEYNWNTIHLDEANLVYGKHINDILVDYCKKWKITIIIFSLLGDSPMNPSHEIYAKLKEMGIYLCFMWPDTGPGWGTQTIHELGTLADLHISWDNPHSPFHTAHVCPENHLKLWVPQDQHLYYKQENKDIDVSFLGSLRYYDRQVLINQLLAHYPTVFIRGGQREEMLSPEKYAMFMRRSKMSINFSLSPAQFFQTKGRVFEILACESLLLEFKNPATSQLFKSGEEFVEFESGKDLADKINYYLNHPEERIRIAENGYLAYQNKYTSRIFWNRVMEKIELDLQKRL